ncbi:MAG TPA: hypothetical protein VKU41_28650 [Polyangiaceae bacterium]|nr:hypothetical protein [Polyangiaceae bacterium]
MRRAIPVGLLVALLAALAGCGGSEPPPKAAAAPPPPEPPKAARSPLKTSSELGSVDPAAVRKAFASLDDKFMDCQKRAVDRVEVLAGDAKFFLRIGQDGSPKWAYLEESEIGDQPTAKCLLDVVMAARWPQPDGGDAEARYSMDLPLQATRPPNDWSSDKATAAITKEGGAIDRCKAGASGPFHGTMYVGPGGKVLAAGVTTASRDDQDKADCLAGLLLKMKGLPSPGSWPAKVSFAL